MLRFTKGSLWILTALSVLAVVATAATPDQARWSFLAGVRLYVGGALLVSILPSLGCSAWFIADGRKKDSLAFLIAAIGSFGFASYAGHGVRLAL